MPYEDSVDRMSVAWFSFTHGSYTERFVVAQHGGSQEEHVRLQHDHLHRVPVHRGRGDVGEVQG
jgi:hypothetical protein